MEKIKVGILGGTGYAGQQLVSILIDHPGVEIMFIGSHSYAGEDYDVIYPHYKEIFHTKLIGMDEAMRRFDEIDLIYSALGHGMAFSVAEKAKQQEVVMIDISGDFRLKNQETYEFWYKVQHTAPELLEEAVYGLPELHREEIKTASLIANPGCYTTASILAVAPLMANVDMINPFSVIIDAKSGVTGAGRKGDIPLLLAEAGESIKAYNVTKHRHTPEIEQELSLLRGDQINITFTPHLIPMKRGILATCYVDSTMFMLEDQLFHTVERFYEDAPFVRVRKEPLETRYVNYTNYCDISLNMDIRNNRIIVTSALDNLVKGAAGQAVQNMNIRFGLEETMGLDRLMPVIP